MTLPRWLKSPHLAAILAVFIFALNYIIGRGIREEVPPFTLGFVRWAGGAIILMPFVLRGLRDDWDALVKKLPVVAVCGFLMPFVGAGMAYVALKSTLAVNASMVQTSLPVLIILIAAVVLRERITVPIAIGSAMAILGVMGIIIRGDLDVLAGLRFYTGDLILLMCNMGLAGYAVLVKFAPKIRASSLLFMLCLFGAIYHAPFFAWEVAQGLFHAPNMAGIGALGFMAFFPSVCAIFLWNYSIVGLGPSRSGVYMYLTPVFGAIMAYGLLGETIAWYHVVGTALIISGVMLTSWRPGGNK